MSLMLFYLLLQRRGQNSLKDTGRNQVQLLLLPPLLQLLRPLLLLQLQQLQQQHQLQFLYHQVALPS
jgi:hypothetical protein